MFFDKFLKGDGALIARNDVVRPYTIDACDVLQSVLLLCTFVDVHMVVGLGSPGAAVVEVQPDSFDPERAYVAHPHVALLKDELALDPTSQHSVVLPGCIQSYLLLDTIPVVVLQSGETVTIP